MVVFDFQEDAAALLLDEDSVSLEAMNTVEHDFVLRNLFWMPVRFAVNGTEMFGSDRGTPPTTAPGWQLLPIFGVALSFVGCPREAWHTGHSATDPWEYGDSVFFDRVEEQIVVRSKFTGQSGTATFPELDAACLGYSHKVREYILSAYPQLRQHPDEELREWLLGEVEIPRWWTIL